MTGADRFREARDVFAELVDLPAAEREARLEPLDRSDPELALAVRGLLESDARAEGFLDEPAPERLGALGSGEDAPAARRGSQHRPSASTSARTELRQLGRGGMGEVWLAERTDGQFEQRVALKLIKRGMDSEELLARFLRERQILARLQHPNIAQLRRGAATTGARTS